MAGKGGTTLAWTWSLRCSEFAVSALDVSDAVSRRIERQDRHSRIHVSN